MNKLILIAALMCSSAHAEFLSGNELLRRLNSADSYERGTAIGYIAGAHDSHRGANHCTPEEISLGQVRDIVKQRLEAAPEFRHYSADSHISYILKSVWPCTDKKGGAL